MTSALRPSARPERAGARLLGLAGDVLDRRLDPGSRAPLCVGFSGGSDSFALLLLTRAWAARAGRPVLALSVDHGLQPASRNWAERSADVARSLGADARILPWRGAKPSSGLPAAARRARHALLAEAARDAGARVVLLGHTADDRLEAQAMQAAGSSVGSPREWAPSPVWPEGRNVFLLRPLLDLRRTALRQVLAEDGWDWIEDPANEDQRYARARARASLKPAHPREGGDPGFFDRLSDAPPDLAVKAPVPGPVANEKSLGPRVRGDERGGVCLERHAAASDPRLLAMACVCAGGGERLPRRDSVERLASRVGAGERFTATLCGARIEARDEVVIVRDPGEASRGGLAPLALEPGVPAVWDGRFLVCADRPGVAVRPLRGLAHRLPHAERRMLKALAPPVRAALPVFQFGEIVTCPILALASWASARSLVRARLAGACGRIARESDLARGSDGEDESGALS